MEPAASIGAWIIAMNPLAYHTYGWTDWLAHMTISAVVHALIYRFVHQLTLAQSAALVSSF